MYNICHLKYTVMYTAGVFTAEKKGVFPSPHYMFETCQCFQEQNAVYSVLAQMTVSVHGLEDLAWKIPLSCQPNALGQLARQQEATNSTIKWHFQAKLEKLSL